MDRAEILRRFERLLDTALTEEAPPAGIPAEILNGDVSPAGTPTDWFTVWSAITALTQETKLQGRAFKQLTDTLAAETGTRTRKESILPLLEIRERLLRGLESARGGVEVRPALLDRVFSARRREIEHARAVVRGLEEGYRLTLAYVDDLLLQAGVRPIQCEGRPFDPRVMSALDTEETDRVAEGTVLTVYRTGYEWNGETLRPAQVRVAKRRAMGGTNE